MPFSCRYELSAIDGLCPIRTEATCASFGEDTSVGVIAKFLSIFRLRTSGSFMKTTPYVLHTPEGARLRLAHAAWTRGWKGPAGGHLRLRCCECTGFR